MVAAVIELDVVGTEGEFIAPAITAPSKDAPYAAQHAFQLSRAMTAKDVRIAQLNHFIRQNGLEPPAYCEGWEI